MIYRPKHMDRIIEQYRTAFAKHGVSPASILIPKGRQDLRFRALTSHVHEDGFSLLDFGCGLADLRAFLDKKFNAYSYSGVDAIPEFVDHCKKKYADSMFFLSDMPDDISDYYDYVVISGTFNIIYADTCSNNFELIQRWLKILFDRTKIALSVDFMIDTVDFQQPGAYHQNVCTFYDFAHQQLSRRLQIDLSYMPYEFAAVIFKQAEIERPANLYR